MIDVYSVGSRETTSWDSHTSMVNLMVEPHNLTAVYLINSLPTLNGVEAR